jgi:hypothetical protein
MAFIEACKISPEKGAESLKKFMQDYAADSLAGGHPISVKEAYSTVAHSCVGDTVSGAYCYGGNPEDLKNDPYGTIAASKLVVDEYELNLVRGEPAPVQ